MTTDHIAEAEELIRACDAMRDGYASEIPWHEIQAAATLAQVHATLATRGEPAGHPVTPYREALTELREAIASAREGALFSTDGTTVSMDRKLWDAVVYLAAGEPR